MTTSKRTHKILSQQGDVLYECELPNGVSDKRATRHALQKAVEVGIPLWDANLAGADLRDADLAGADLARADLHGADLSHADLADACLVLANLSGAVLWDANLTHANLYCASLDHADLPEARLTHARLTGASLIGACLEYADLARANLTHANLAGTKLNGACLTGTDIDAVELGDTELAGAHMQGPKLVGSRPLLRIGPIGPDGRTLSIWLTDAGPRIQTNRLDGTYHVSARDEFDGATGLDSKSIKREHGFFGMTREEFCATIAHGDDAHAQEYRAALALIDKHAELWMPKAQPTQPAGDAMNDQKRIDVDRQVRLGREIMEQYFTKNPGRDPKRIDEMLAELRELWMTWPDTRLGQMVVNIIGPRQPTPEVFYVEDDEFLIRLRKFREGHE